MLQLFDNYLLSVYYEPGTVLAKINKYTTIYNNIVTSIMIWCVFLQKDSIFQHSADEGIFHLK